MGKWLGRKRGVKRHNQPAKSGSSKHVRKHVRVEEKVARSPSPSCSGESSEEQSSGVASEEEVVYKEPSMFDNLLSTLGMGSESLANAYKRRQRDEEGKSDTDEDMDGGSESLMMSEDEGSEEGTEDEPTRNDNNVGSMEQSEDAETDNDHEAFDSDQEHDFFVDGQSAVGASENMW